MSFKDDKGKEEIEKLVEMHRILTKQLNDKQDLIDKMSIEIHELKEVLNYTNKIIAGKSFTPASNLLISDALFIEDIGTKGEGTLLSRRIQSKNNELLCILKFADSKHVEIKFIDPEKTNVKEKSELYLSEFIQQTLLKIKETHPNLELTIDKYENSDFIERMIIKNVNTTENFDLITNGIERLLGLL